MWKVQLLGTLLGIVLLTVEYSNFYVTLGDKFVRKDSPIMFRVGYMVKGSKGNHFPLYANKIRLMTPQGKIFDFPVGTCRNYFYNGSPATNKEQRYYELRKEQGRLKGDPLLERYFEETGESIAKYEKIENEKKLNPKSKPKVNSILNYYRNFCFHDLLIENLEIFSYWLINEKGEQLTRIFQFKSKIAITDKPRVAILGDHDLDATGIHVLEQMKNNELDLIIFLGDLAYELTDFNGLKGDYYFEIMEELISKVPFVMTPGNHEIHNDFHMIAARFYVPGGLLFDSISLFSFSMNNWLFVLYNFSPAVYEQRIGFHSAIQQIDEHLEARKKEFNPEWIFFVSHLPFYCSLLSEHSKPECFDNGIFIKPFEDILHYHNVNFRIGGHVHGYERMSHVYGLEKQQDSDKGTIVIGNGCASSHHLDEKLKMFPFNYSEKILLKTSGFSIFNQDNQGQIVYKHIDELGLEVDSKIYFKESKFVSFKKWFSSNKLVCFIILLFLITIIGIGIWRIKRIIKNSKISKQRIKKYIGNSSSPSDTTIILDNS